MFVVTMENAPDILPQWAFSSQSCGCAAPEDEESRRKELTVVDATASVLRGKVGAESTRFNQEERTMISIKEEERGCDGGRSIELRAANVVSQEETDRPNELIVWLCDIGSVGDLGRIGGPSTVDTGALGVADDETDLWDPSMSLFVRSR